MRINRYVVALALFAAGCFSPAAAQSPDPLPSWNDGAAKKNITDFVVRVTAPGVADFVPVTTHCHLRRRRHAVDRETDLLSGHLRARPHTRDGAATSGIAKETAIQSRNR